MAASKSSSVLMNANPCSAGFNTLSSTLNLTTAYGAILTVQIANGSSPPGAPAIVTVNVSPDGSAWEPWTSGAAGLGVSTTYNFSWEIPPAVAYAQVMVNGNTTNAVTAWAQAQVLSSI